MLIDEQKFKSFFNYKLFKKLKESIYPMKDVDKASLLNELYEEVSLKQKHTFPETIDYFVMNKGNGVTRILPIFSLKTICLYHYVIRMIEDKLVLNRVEGTYGGYRIGHAFLKKEKGDQESDLDCEYSGSTRNPKAWNKEWNTFIGHVYRMYSNSNFKSIIKYDVANFYDTINLTRLEQKIRYVTDSSDEIYINLLGFILKNWNYKINSYKECYSGLPQNEGGDESRILANFYLQAHDKFMKENCEKMNATFLRYADDVVIYAPDAQTACKLLWKASKFLNKEGLNINAAKVKLFDGEDGLEKFNIYWGFSIHDFIDCSEWENAKELYNDYKAKGYEFRELQILRRFISKKGHFDINFWNQYIINSDFLSKCRDFDFKNIYDAISKYKTLLLKFEKILNFIVENTFFSYELYQILSFNRKTHCFSDGFNQKIQNRLNILKKGTEI